MKMQGECTQHDKDLAARGRPDHAYRFRSLSPGWSSACTGCEDGARLCVYVRPDCPDNVHNMRLVASRGSTRYFTD